jgi:hypothetical protein
MRYLIIPDNQINHMNDPNAMTLSEDATHMQNIIKRGAVEYVKAVNKCNELRAENSTLHDDHRALVE